MLLEIKRVSTDNEGTLGVLYTNGFACYTLELPWRDNKPFISCIPEGLYTIALDDSVIIGKKPVLRFYDVKGRWGILIHVGNYAGDVSAGNKSDVSGCIAIGFGYDDNIKQKMITDSREAMEELLALVKNETVAISIENLMEVKDGEKKTTLVCPKN